MNFFSTAPILTGIQAVFSLCLIAGCAQHDRPNVAAIDIGSNVLLQDYALACTHPSEELNNVAKSNGKDLRDLYEKISRFQGCYEASLFEQGQWKVLAKNDAQMLIKMQGHAGEYWVSTMHIKPGLLPAFRSAKNYVQLDS